MNGVYENAVLTALKEHKNLSEIVICTDNDIGGIDAADRLTDILRENNYENISRISPKNKDFNEDLKQLRAGNTKSISEVQHLAIGNYRIWIGVGSGLGAILLALIAVFVVKRVKRRRLA